MRAASRYEAAGLIPAGDQLLFLRDLKSVGFQFNCHHFGDGSELIPSWRINFAPKTRSLWTEHRCCCTGKHPCARGFSPTSSVLAPRFLMTAAQSIENALVVFVHPGCNYIIATWIDAAMDGPARPPSIANASGDIDSHGNTAIDREDASCLIEDRSLTGTSETSNKLV